MHVFQKKRTFKKNERISKEYPKKQEKCSREHESEGQTKGRSERFDKQCHAGFISSEVDNLSSHS